MKSASIIVIPSIWEEPFGLVAAEAMSNGACIIASKVGGIPEIIKDNGILIDKINLKKLSSKIEFLIKNNFKRKLSKLVFGKILNFYQIDVKSKARPF